MYETEQAMNVTPPRLGKVATQAVDSTSRVYDLTALALGDATWKDGVKDFLYLTIKADGADIYFVLGPNNGGTINDTAAVAAGSPMAFAATSCDLIKNGDRAELRIARDVDRYLYLKTASGTAIARIYASSQPTPAAAL